MEEGQDKKKKYRIGMFSAAILLGGAAIADIASIIPFVGDFTGPIYWILASFYMWKLGCGLINGKQFATRAISMVAEMIPVIQEFPMTIAGAAAAIAFVYFEDKTGLKLSEKGGVKGAHLNTDGVRLPSATQAPLNDGGIRQPRESGDN